MNVFGQGGKAMRRTFKRLISDNRGTSAVEYGFLAAMIVIGLVASVKGVGDETQGLWATVTSKSKEAIEKK